VKKPFLDGLTLALTLPSPSGEGETLESIRSSHVEDSIQSRIIYSSGLSEMLAGADLLVR
jgi:hypothetical protein